MQKIKITDQMLSRAKRNAEVLGCLSQSITKGRGNIAGLLGEELVLYFLPHSKQENTFDYDIIHDDLKIDVKTKRTTVIPKAYYECSVADFNTRQQCDIYLFTRVFILNEMYPYGWLLGYIRKTEFYEQATFHKKGEFDSSNNFIFKADCYNIAISQLSPVQSLLNYREESEVSVNLAALFKS